VTNQPAACAGPHRAPETNPDWQWPRAEYGLLCERCRGRLSSLLIRLPQIAEWLHANLAPSQGQQADRVSGSREDPIPLRQDILDLIGPAARLELSEAMGTTRRELNSAGKPERVQVGNPQLEFVIRTWAKQVKEESGQPWPDRNDLTALCRWLSRQLDWITRQPWVGDLLEQLVDLSWRAFWLAPDEAERHLLKPPCPSCDLRALIFTRGVGVECEPRMGGCGRTWTDEHFDRLVIVLGTEALIQQEAV
jgi:hypothetical protein